jgi:hypothetical protein
MKLAQIALIVAPAWVAACSGGGGPSTQSSSAASESAASAEADPGAVGCPPVGPYDASTFTFRSSCVYVIASDASTLSACDEWSQGSVGDWGAFIEGCTAKDGDLAATPCTAAGRVGECELAASCESQLVTYYYGAAGAQSFELACVASVGATWTSL